MKVDITDSDSDVLLVLHDEVRIEGVFSGAADVVAHGREQAAHVVVDAGKVQRGWHTEPAHRERRTYGGTTQTYALRKPPSECAQRISGGDKTLTSHILLDVGEHRDDQVALVRHRDGCCELTVANLVLGNELLQHQ